MLAAGTLNRRVTIQQPSTEQDAEGQPEAVWTDVATVWANIAHKKGLQAIRSDAEVSIVRASIRVRYRTDVVAGMRALFRTTVYKVIAVLPDEEGREYIDLVCEVST